MEYAVHGLATDANNKLREEVSKMEGVNQGFREILKKWKAWYNEQLEREREEAHQVQIRLDNEKGQLIDRHLRETEI